MDVIELSDPASWPAPITRALEMAFPMLSSYEQERAVIDKEMHVNVLARINPPVNPHAAARDTLIAAFDETMQQLSIRAWHCTRLLPYERTWIEEGGLARHRRALFVRRLDAAVESGALAKADADRRLRRSQVGEPGRDGLLHLILNRGVLRDESDVGDLMRNWGGEAIYNNLGRDADRKESPLARLSLASIIEAKVPIRLLTRLPLSIGEQIVNRYAHDYGVQTEHGWGTNAKLIEDLAPGFVSAIVLRDDQRFGELTGCAGWRTSV